MGNNSGYEVDLHALDTIAKELDEASHSLGGVPGAVDGAALPPELDNLGDFAIFRASYRDLQATLKSLGQTLSKTTAEGANAVRKTRRYFEQAESENTRNLNSAGKSN